MPKNSIYHFVNPKLRQKYEELPDTRIFCNIVILVNCRTGYVHLDATYTRRFEELKNILEDFFINMRYTIALLNVIPN